jgi:hypothetical protein
VAVHRVVCSGQQAVLEEKALQTLCQLLNEWKIHLYVSVLKLPLLVDLQQKVGELVPSIAYCLTIILESVWISVYNKCVYGNFNYQYNVFPIPVQALLCVRNLSKVVCVCVNCLWSGLWLLNVWERLT